MSKYWQFYKMKSFLKQISFFFNCVCFFSLFKVHKHKIYLAGWLERSCVASLPGRFREICQAKMFRAAWAVRKKMDTPVWKVDSGAQRLLEASGAARRRRDTRSADEIFRWNRYRNVKSAAQSCSRFARRICCLLWTVQSKTMFALSDCISIIIN